MKSYTEKILKTGIWIAAIFSFIGAFHLIFTTNAESFILNKSTFLMFISGLAISIIMLVYFLIQGITAYFFREADDLNDSDLPKCTVIVPAYNEGEYVATTLKSVIASDYPAEKLEITAVNDGSNDDTWEWISKTAEEFPNRINTINMCCNMGKRHALYEGIKTATGDIIVTIDSDSEITADALRKIASPFAKQKIGAVAGNIRVTNLQEGFIPKMLDTAFAFGFEFIRCAQSRIGSVLCTPGALSAYRSEAILPLMEEWVNQTFMGKPSGIGEDRAITSMLIRENWRVEFQQNAIAYTKMPVNYKMLCKMLIRWTRSDIRENMIMLNVVLRRFEPFNIELLGLQLNLIIQSIAILLPLFFIPMLVCGIFINPLLTVYYTIIGTMVWSAIPAMIYWNRYSKSESVWSFIYGLYSILCLCWIPIYSLFTVRNSKWMTRGIKTENILIITQPEQLITSDKAA